jgi:hypothetical protein
MIAVGWLVGCGLYSAKTATLRHFWERLRLLGEWWQKRDQKSRLFGAAFCWVGGCPICSSF